MGVGILGGGNLDEIIMPRFSTPESLGAVVSRYVGRKCVIFFS